MTVGELWRYPVKSLAGERIARAHVREDGIAGDRVLQVVDEHGSVISARTHPRLLALQARTDELGQVRIAGLPWSDPAVVARVRWAAGPGARLAPVRGAQRFDILPLLVATDGAIAAFGHDGRRLRPNLVISGVDGLSERAWEGALLRAGESVIGVHSLRDRCVVTTYDPDTLERDVDVLRGIHLRFDGKLALNCWVVQPGVVRVGDAVELIDAAHLDAAPPREVLGRMVR